MFPSRPHAAIHVIVRRGINHSPVLDVAQTISPLWLFDLRVLALNMIKEVRPFVLVCWEFPETSGAYEALSVPSFTFRLGSRGAMHDQTFDFHLLLACLCVDIHMLLLACSCVDIHAWLALGHLGLLTVSRTGALSFPHHNKPDLFLGLGCTQNWRVAVFIVAASPIGINDSLDA